MLSVWFVGKLRKVKENGMTYRASSLAALGLQNLPLLSILGNVCPDSEDFSRGFSAVRAEVRREAR